MKILPANRLANTQEYYFSQKMMEITAMNAEGKDVINLAIGNPNMSPDPKVIEALKLNASNPLKQGYQPTKTVNQFREAYSKWYKTYFNVDLDFNTECLGLIGSKEGVFYASFALLNQGDEVLIPNPGYPMYKAVTEMLEAVPKDYMVSEETDWLPDLQQIEKNLSGKEKAIWINYPNNPTGAQATLQFFEELVKFALKHNIVILHDNPYSHVLTENRLSIMQVPEARECAVELTSLSKAYSMAGWRTGVAVGNKDLLKLILTAKSNVDSGSYLPIQEAAVTALSLDESWFEHLNSVYTKRKVAANRLADALNLEYSTNTASMYVWGKIKGNNLKSAEFADKLLYDYGIFIAPGTLYGTNGEGYMRISLCHNPETIDKAINRLQ